MGSQHTLQEIFDSLSEQDMTTLGYRLIEHFYSLDAHKTQHRRDVLKEFRKRCRVEITDEQYHSFRVRVWTLIFYKKTTISTTRKQREESFWIPKRLFWMMVSAPSIGDSDAVGS